MTNHKSVFFLLAIFVFLSASQLFASKGKIALVVSNVEQFAGPHGKAHGAGVWADELVVPQRIFENAGFEVVITSPTGGSFIFDKNSYDSNFVQDKQLLAEVIAYKKHNAAAMEKTAPLADIDVDDFVAIFVAGGHGVMFDVATEPLMATLTKEFLDKGKVVAAVCHGPCFLAKAYVDGKAVIKGYKVTGFSNEEEKQAQMTELMPFSLEDGLNEATGGLYSRGAPWGANVVVDRKLVTGQNPASSHAAAEAVTKLLK